MRLNALIKKEFLQLFRDRILILVLIYAFTLDIYVSGAGISFTLKHYPVVIWNQTPGFEAREIIDKIREPYFKIIGFVNSEKELRHFLDSGKASMGLIIQDKKLQAVVDGTMSVSATLAIAYLTQIFYKSSYQIVSPRIRILFNPNKKSSWFMSLLELFNMISMISILLPAAALIKEKEQGTIEQLIISPLKPWEIFLAKILPTLIVVSILSLISLFIVIKPAFHVVIKGNLLVFTIVNLAYIFTMASLGIAIATLVDSLAKAMLFLLAIFVPMLMLSGAWSPVEAMHPVVQVFSFLSPMRYYIELSFAILLKGSPLIYVWSKFMGILLIGTFLFIFSLIRFRKSFAK